MATKKRKRRKKKQQNDRLVLKLLILVAVVLFVFEGRLVYTMATHRPGQPVETAAKVKPANEVSAETETEAETSLQAQPNTARDAMVTDSAVAGFPYAMENSEQKDTRSVAVTIRSAGSVHVSEELDSPAVVQKADTPVDDSYFANAVFIGDSRMQGFQNASGITQGTFLTSVGLSTDEMSSQTIATPDGAISVYQGLSGEQYNRIYLMLGTNDLGYYPWDSFESHFEDVIVQFHELQPDATIYVCSVIYVDESKTTTSYNNNENVRKINGYLLNVCEDLDYCYYINLNEIFSNGYGSLKEDASEDGIHLQPKYCEQMLDFLKTHYVPETDSEETESESAKNTDTLENEAAI